MSDCAKNCKGCDSGNPEEQGCLSSSAPADDIVADLFRNGFGDEAERLVLYAQGRDIGGWCRDAVRDVIVRHLSRERLIYGEPTG